MKYAAYGSYEPSKSVWFDQLPSHWQQLRVKHVIERMESGVSVNSDASPASNEEIGVLKTSCVYGDQFSPQENKRVLDEQIERVACPVKANRLIISRMNTPELVGSCGYVDHDFPNLYLPDRLWQAVFSKSRKCSPKFAWYYLTSRPAKSAISSLAAGTSASMQNIAQDAFVGIGFPLPPLDEQQTIARFLDAKTAQIDELIAKKRLLIAKLKEKRQALIARTVTHGLPPEAAKAAGLEPNPNPEMKDSGVDFLGVVPKTWNVVRLKHVLNAKKGAIKTGPFGSQLHGSEMLESEIKVFNQRTVIDRDISSGDNYISLEKFEELKSFEVFPGDLLVTTRGTIGRCMVVPDGAEKGILHPCLMRLQLNKIHITDRYLELLIEESGYVIDQLRLMSNATTIEVIYSESLKEVWLAVPPLNVQCKIIEYLDRGASKLDALVERTVLAIARLTEYRQALITAAVTGKIDVCEAA